MATAVDSDGWFEDRFSGPDVDPATWLPYYLPAWSSRADTRAIYHLSNNELTLEIPVDHPVWCADDHDPPLRVSGLMSGNWSGPAGTTKGQQRFEGWLPSGGRVEISARMQLSPRSMAALWMGGFEDDDAQEQSGELCVFEIFGNALGPVDDPSDEAVFTVDEVVVRRCPNPPTYPLQLRLALFDFPQDSVGDDDHLVPRLVVDRVAGTRR